MKKGLVWLLIGILLCGSASAEGQSELESITIRMKALLGIGDEYTDFSGEVYQDAETGATYHLEWERDDESLSVRCDTRGVPYSVYYYRTSPDGPYDGYYAPRLPMDREEEANETAEAFLAKVLAEGESYVIETCRTDTEQIIVSGVIVRGGIPTEAEWDLTLDASDLNLTSYRRYDKGRAYKDTEIAIDEAEARRVLEEKLKIEMRYVKIGDRIRPMWVIAEGANELIDAATGLPRKGIAASNGSSEVASAKGMAMDEAAAEEAPSLTSTEIAAIERVENVLSQDELDAIARGIPEFGITDPFTLTKMNLYRSDDTIEAELTYEYRRRYIYVYLNAETGKLLNMNSYGSDNILKLWPKYSDEECGQIAQGLLTRCFPEWEGHCVIREGKDGAVNFSRLENGVPYDGDRAYVHVDRYSGRVEYVSSSFTEDAVFEPADFADADAAREAFLRDTQVTPVYAYVERSRGFRDPTYEYTPCYRIRYASETLDGATLEAVEERPQEEGAIVYEDEVTDIVARMAKAGIGLREDRFDGEKALTLRSALTLLLSPDDWFYTAKNDRDLLSLADDHYIPYDKALSLDDTISRADFAKMLIAMSGYGRAAKVPGIYVCGFADADRIADDDLGYIAIAAGMGIAVADENGCFRPDDTATRNEAAEMFYAFLTREY